MDMFDFLSKATSSQNTEDVIKATEKLKAEMEKEKNNGYVQEVGKFLLQELNIKLDLADKMLNPEKTILNSLEVMKSKAEKIAEANKNGNTSMVMFTPQEGFDIVLKYFADEIADEDEGNEGVDNQDK